MHDTGYYVKFFLATTAAAPIVIRRGVITLLFQTNNVAVALVRMFGEHQLFKNL